MKSIKAIAAVLLAGVVLSGPAYSGTTTTKIVRDHRGQNSNQLRPPKDHGWGNGSGTVRDHRKPPPFPCVVRTGLPTPGC